jgi:hypothetical protein
MAPIFSPSTAKAGRIRPTRVLVAAILAPALVALNATERSSIFPPFTPERNRYAHRLVTEQFEIVQSLQQIDPAVLKAYYKIVPRRDIAVGSQAFAETDVSDGRSKRFDFAGHGSGLWFIVYEVGGRAYHYSIIFFERSGSSWHRVAAAAGFPERGDFPSVVRAVKKGRFDEMSDDLNL